MIIQNNRILTDLLGGCPRGRPPLRGSNASGVRVVGGATDADVVEAIPFRAQAFGVVAGRQVDLLEFFVDGVVGRDRVEVVVGRFGGVGGHVDAEAFVLILHCEGTGGHGRDGSIVGGVGEGRAVGATGWESWGDAFGDGDEFGAGNDGGRLGLVGLNCG